MNDNYTHLTIVVDRSGSMASIQKDAEGGINNLIGDQKLEPGWLTLTLIQFDDEYQVVHDGVDIHDVPEYILSPRGMTALNDAIGKGINQTGEFLAKMDEADRPANVLFVIVTDGGENSSREFTSEQVKEMVKHQTDVYGWDFTFIGANIDAFATGSGLGITNSVQYAANSHSNNAMYAGLTRSVSTVRSKGGSVQDTIASDYS